MATFVHGTDSTLTVDGVQWAGPGKYLTEVNPSFDIDNAEVTVLGDLAKSYIPGLEDGSFSTSGFYDRTYAGLVDGLRREIVPFIYMPEGAGTGKPQIAGNCLMSSFEFGSTTDDAISLDVEFQITGVVAYTIQA